MRVVLRVVLVCVTLALILPSNAMGFGPFECSNGIFFNHDDIGKMRSDQDFWIVVRVLGDCETERQVKLIRRGDQIEAEVTQPLDYPIRVQLSRLENKLGAALLEPQESVIFQQDSSRRTC